MINITIPTHMVIDMFGSKIISKHNTPPPSKTGINPQKLFILPVFFARYEEENSTKQNFAISLGCKVKPGSLIHLLAP